MPDPLTITEAAGFIQRGELTPSELLEQCFSRIDRYEERVRAWVYLDRDRARQEAERLTTELKSGQNRGPLHGIPIGVKDIIDVFDMPTGCGSKLWANSYARRDATVVERLRQAGAVIMGKTVTTAFASFDPPVTRNPWNLERTPGGSSSGSAAAVACGMCLGALATQTGGSITRPASYCGVYSIKPTYGRVSVDGVMPLAPSMDHVGAMANCVRDLAILLQAIARADGDDVPRSDHYLVAVDGGWQQFRRELVTLPDFPARADQEMDSAFAALGEKVIRERWRWYALPLPPSFADVPRFHHTVMAVEAAAFHADRVKRYPDDYPPKVAGLISTGTSRPGHEYSRILAHMKAFRVEIDGGIVEETWKTLITPATAGAAPTIETTGDPAFNAPWSYSGLPTISLPFTWTEAGLPLAVQLIGRRWWEDELLAAAAMLEADIGFERRPLPL
jgi:Asp-tRNA(Asn)/Glu-tRNA(Gln) amidotransferase A subunit family amidase